MADEKLIRLANLGEALKRVPERDRARYLFDKLGSSIPFWSGLLGGSRTFGEKIARRIEDGLEWPRGCLDSDAAMSPDEIAILRAYRSLPEGQHQRAAALAYVQGLADAAHRPRHTPGEALKALREGIALRDEVADEAPSPPSPVGPPAKRSKPPPAPSS